ncbi:MAG: hypothetical protein IJC85_03890 [Oscillospiraceae bacterium]|nr:hypothetical protein [Oscillospiraceae bacterium]
MMKFFSRFLIMTLALLTLVCPLVSCGGGEEEKSSLPSEPVSEVSSVIEIGYDYSRPVPKVEGDWAKKSYFSDAVFIGDSVTTGLTIYSFFENATVLAERGIDPDNIFTKNISSENKTIMALLAEKEYAKIYIMLGANAAVYMSAEEYITAYAKMLDEIVKLQPNAVIYIQAVFPVTKALSDSNTSAGKTLTNETIIAYNTKLLQLAAEKKVYFVNTFECMAKEGAMPSEYSPDGVHINAAQYQLWYDYLRSHVIIEG